MAEQQFQERTEPATPKRLKEAREKGQVPRSRELTTMAVTLAAAAALLLLGGPMLGRLAGMMSRTLSPTREQVMGSDGMLDLLGGAVMDSVALLMPYLGILALVAALAPLALGGWSFSPAAMAFKGERINPIAGIKRVFSRRGLMELAKALAKFLIVGGAAVLLLETMAGDLVGLSLVTLRPALAQAASLCLLAFLVLSATLALIAAVDVPFQIADHAKKQRMTRQEVRDENKETEGRPEVRGRIRALQQEMAGRRMLEDVVTATVVITNPTHYAVALRYAPDEADAPVLVAKGIDHLALRIRERAAANDVPVFRAPPLARALYASVRLGAEIDERLYVAVAQVLTYVYQLKLAAETGAPPPEPPEPAPMGDEEWPG